MKKWTAKELRKCWLSFYESKGHVVIPSASVIPDNDPSVLFTTAGMHPLVPYLLGQKHPLGKRLTNVQKCIRTGDIDSVGDNSHLTFFEMLGNWSLGDYFKKDKIAWSYDFITNPKYLGLKQNQFAVTVFAGNDFVERDNETAEIWRSLGVPEERIFFLGFDDNFWQINRGPCGPDSEVFLDTGKEKCCDECSPSCHCGKYIEIGNDVFMQYNRIDENEYILANQKNVDTGYGLERNLIALNGEKSVYTTEVFESAMKKIEELSGKIYIDSGDEYTKSFRIIADHVRCSTAILGDINGIVPSNTDAGYVLRRLIRKSVRHARILGVEQGKLGEIASVYIEYFREVYPEFLQNKNKIISEINKEEEKFLNTLSSGLKEFSKVVSGIQRKNEFMKMKDQNYKQEKSISGKTAFMLYERFGFPLEMTEELACELGFEVDVNGYNEAYKSHQDLARAGSEQHFKGGLSDQSDKTTRMHTATHLLLAGLRKVLGDNVYQKGCNITPERIRFDFSFDRSMTSEEINSVELFVNQAIHDKLDVEQMEMTLDDAKNMGAMGVFEDKYGDRVNVYKIKNVSLEICGGPHVKNTSEIGRFKIIKEQSSSSGVRRIRAEIE